MTLSTTGDKVAAAERELAAKLPREFRDRLIANNGGELVTAGSNWRVFPVLDSSDPKRAEKTSNHIVKQNREAQKLPGFPPGAIAIAKNRAGDLLVFLPGQGHGELQGIVHLWDHELRACKATALDFS